MQLEKIKELAAHMEDTLTFVGILHPDTGIDVRGRESQEFDNPQQALEAARAFAEDARRTRLQYSVQAHIGQDIVITSVDGFEGTT